jgi:hypothetical protein
MCHETEFCIGQTVLLVTRPVNLGQSEHPTSLETSFADLRLCSLRSTAMVSYQPYTYQWDDSIYLGHAIAASKAFWSGDRHAMHMAIVDWGTHPPVMSLLGLPWGPLASWDADGKCFLSLAVLTAVFVAWCLRHDLH